MPTHPFHSPGRLLADWLDAVSMPRAKAAARLGCGPDDLERILDDAAPIGAETAARLARLTGIGAISWIHREAEFRHTIGQIADERSLAEYVGRIHPDVVTYLRDLGATTATIRDPGRLVADFLAYHQCGDWNSYENYYAHLQYPGTATARRVDPTVLSSWLRAGTLAQRYSRRDQNPFDRDGLLALIPRLRDVVGLPGSATMMREAAELLAGVGLFLGTVRPPSGSPLSAATGWIGTAAPAMIQCGREHRDGVVIWNLFHQIGHILQFRSPGTDGFSRGTVVFVEFLRGTTPASAAGRDADHFATRALLGADGLGRVEGAHTIGEIREAAAEIGVRPGVAACVMQRAGMLSPDLSRDLMAWIDPNTGA